MNERQSSALAHPLNRADMDRAVLALLREVAPLRDGNLLCSILAVDR